MSTTVTYEGSTIATVENNTKTLQTKGKYLTDDITLTDTSQSGSAAISITDELDSHGGTIRHINGVDISDSTIDTDKVLSGYVGYKADGTRIVGTASAGITPTGTVSITENGTHDVTNYASVSVPAGSATTPATAITSNPSISVDSAGLITATTSASQQVTPTVSAGYVSEGTAGTVTVSGSSTEQLPTLGAQTVTPTKSSQIVQTTGKYMTGDVTVDPIPSQYIVPSGSVTITENGTTDVTDKASVTVAISYATITVSSSAPSGGSDGDVWIQN